MLRTMSWLLVVALLVVFVVRMSSSMMARSRLRAGTDASGPVRPAGAVPAADNDHGVLRASRDDQQTGLDAELDSLR
jgi:hypothetical protein